ncbi:MAG: mevalonate kinase [Sulfolobales archaeon]
MRRVVASAPGKVTLFGEHAVVYGEPALVMTIGRRVYVTAELRGDNNVRIVASDLQVPGVTVTFAGDELLVETDYGKTLSAIAYLRSAVDIVSKYLGVFKGVNITVRSEMPVGAGLGTSAAVAVATVLAYAKVLGYDLERREIARLGWEVEKTVQGVASPMDTSITTFGGVIKVKLLGNNNYEVREVPTSTSPPIVIGYVEREAKTKDLIAKVRKLRERHTEIIDSIIRTIGVLVLEAEKALVSNDLTLLGELMNINQGLLDALGVSNKRLNDLIYAARVAGALGSKITGAGGGGCVIALAPNNQEAVEVAMKLSGGLTMKTSLGGPGALLHPSESTTS